MSRLTERIPAPARKPLVGLAGGIVLALAAVFWILPGPGIALTIAGLALLATEFEWAERAMARFKAWLAGSARFTARLTAALTDRLRPSRRADDAPVAPAGTVPGTLDA